MCLIYLNVIGLRSNFLYVFNRAVLLLGLVLTAHRKFVCATSLLSNLFYGWFFSLGMLLFVFNVTGLFPFSFTPTSHLIITLSIACIFFGWINFVLFLRFYIQWVSLFLPSGTPILILPLIVPIEVLSYVARLFSLAIRLFANMMSGHTLLAILMGFVYLGINFNIFFFAAAFLIHMIFLMEAAVALIQIYVFTVLSSLYLQDTYSSIGGH